tara:strand:- start:446 stop:712 length:267 start_codon:yes stop_codon:yes gene_type:complete
MEALKIGRLLSGIATGMAAVGAIRLTGKGLYPLFNVVTLTLIVTIHGIALKAICGKFPVVPVRELDLTKFLLPSEWLAATSMSFVQCR